MKQYVCCAFFCLVNVVFSFILSNELNALKELYYSTNGDYWTFRNESEGLQWNFTSSKVNPCNDNGNVWQGIICSNNTDYCDTEKCHIVELNLQSYNLSGSITSLEQLYMLSSIDLSHNSIRGHLITIISNLTHLEYLNMGYNYINGSISYEITQLTKLKYLYMNSNLLSHTISEDIWKMESLHAIDFSHNQLNGSIIIQEHFNSSLKYLDISYNYLTGSIPNYISNFVFLQFFYGCYNKLHDKIPSDIGMLSNLVAMDIGNNYLTNTIPNELYDIKSLRLLVMQVNLLSGSVSSYVNHLTSIQDYDIDNNFLSSSFPTEFGDLTKLRYVELGVNLITGIIPPELGKLSLLFSIYSDNNQISGSLPPELGQMTSLQYLSLDSNLLTGCIPFELSNMQLLYTDLHDNMLECTIPMEFEKLQDLSTLYIDNNYLTGTIPSSLGNMKSLEILSLNNNKLSGIIPSTIGKLIKLKEFYVQTNQLSGHIDHFLYQSSNMSIVNIDISDNKFDGSIPKELFMFHNLEVLAMTSNCFDSSIPTTVCYPKKISVYSMDGLGAGKKCTRSTLSPTTENILNNVIPDCIWSMTSLRVLSLSGNRLTGKIGKLNENSSLINLTLSHNYISGIIPDSVANKYFTKLDLSYNKITGEYKAEPFNITNPSSILKLAVNRLSGKLSDSLSQYLSVDVLSGNIYSCNNLLENDKNLDTYSCGSKELNDSLYLCLAIGLLFMIIGIIAFHLYRYQLSNNTINRIIKSIQSNIIFVKSCWMFFLSKDFDKSEFIEIALFNECLILLLCLFIVLLIIGTILSIPLFVLKILDNGSNEPLYSTHSHMYGWIMTTAYITGQIPAVLVLLIWVILIFAFALCIQSIKRKYNETERKSAYKDDNTDGNVFWKVVGLLLFNIITVGLVNGLYIYSTLLTLSYSAHTCIRIAIALFKSIWNFIIVPGVILVPLKDSSRKAWMKLAVGLINSVFVPCLATAFTSTSCFQGLFIEPDEISSSYDYIICSRIATSLATGDTYCAEFSTITKNVVPLVPPFTYHNLCGSVILTSYISVYLYIYSFQVIGSLVGTYVCANYVQYSTFPFWMHPMLLGIMWPLHWSRTWKDQRSSSIDMNEDHGADRLASKYSNSKFAIALQNFTARRNASQVVTSSAFAEVPQPKQLIKINTIITEVMHHFAIFLTFGVSCPFLALSIVAYVGLCIIQWRYLMGRFFIHRLRENDKNQSDISLYVLERACSGCDKYVVNCMWLVIYTSSIFYTFLCWDMASDHMHWINAIWIPLIALNIPFCIWLYIRFNPWTGRSTLCKLSFNSSPSLLSHQDS